MTDISNSDTDIDYSSITTTPSANGSETEGVGLANPQLSQGRRHMLDLVNKLHSTGVQVDIDLPQIAVIGSQSAGKSSLIESISGITLPRAAGTCTRCPTEIRLSCSTGRWECSISLRFVTDVNGQAYSQIVDKPFGQIVHDKQEVEERIRRAQRAILNPSRPSKDFLDGDDEDVLDPECSFSTNCVCLQIRGPGVADLSFCDLPGLIASVGREGNTGDIELVKSLVTSYIKRPSCIILLTVACETDFENQGAHRLAKELDPEGKRTIGVLTKPDRIPQGEESRWLPFIRNEKETLANNWYCVKQPNSNDLKQGITWAEARTRENEFFSMVSPWSELDGVYQKYLRTANLVGRLSSLLSDLISKRLPQIQEELENSITKTRELLSLLPKEPSKDPLSDVVTLLHRFTSDLARHIEGVSDSNGLIQAIRPANETFRASIRATAPNFQPFEKKDATDKHLPKASFLANEEEVEEVGVIYDEYDSSWGELVISRKKKEHRGAIYVEEVLKRANEARTRELPGTVPFVVQQTYIDTFIREWKTPMLILCKTVYVLLMEHVKNLVAVHFSSFGQGALEQRARIILQELVKKCFKRAEQQAKWLLDMEDRPFSLNTHYLCDYKDKFLSHFKGAREKYRNGKLLQAIETHASASVDTTYRRGGSLPEPTAVAKVLAGLTELGITGVKPEDLPRVLPPDEMEPALNIMADVRAYFQVSYKRFADNVPLAIDYELVRGIQREVLKTLYSGLGVNGPDGHRICKELAQESPHIADRREELLKKLERLNVASEQLLHIGF